MNDAHQEVWTVVQRCLLPHDFATVGRIGRHKRSQYERAAAQYQNDALLYSIQSGTKPVVENARERLNCLPGAMELMLKMVSFDSAERPTMEEILDSTIFNSLRKEKNWNRMDEKELDFKYCFSG